MTDTRIISRNPFDTLAQEHESIRDLIEECQDLDTMQVLERMDLLRRIEEEVTTHVSVQNLIVFPVLGELNDTEISASIAQRKAEHRELYVLLIDVREAYTPLLFDLAMIRLRFKLHRHLEAEEKEIYPIAARLSRETLNRISTDLENRERETRQFRGETD